MTDEVPLEASKEEEKMISRAEKENGLILLAIVIGPVAFVGLVFAVILRVTL